MDQVPNEPRWSEPRRQHISCALDPSNPTENNSTLAVAFAVADINDVYECFVLQVTFIYTKTLSLSVTNDLAILAI